MFGGGRVQLVSEQPVGLGAIRDQLRRLLGEPTDASVRTRRRRQAMIWKYADIEYHFREDGRVWIVNTEDARGDPQVLGQLA
jgi:hypothetical protein